MDGNGRWAKQKGRPRMFGHREGVESVRVVLKACAEFGVKYLTVYTFSTENWNRPREEVDFLMHLFSQTIDREINELMKEGVRLRFLGQLERFSDVLRKKMRQAMEKTAGNSRITLNIMVNYGGRDEIVNAVQTIINEGRKTIDEADFGNYLFTAGVPDPDLLVRTASEMRISNFLLWQIAYSEIYVTATLWPDFRREELGEAIEAYQKRERRFGKIA
jgi:undecaprenyl diphosphate synthase